jgi:GNAT superfamily N-acetyltransferase
MRCILQQDRVSDYGATMFRPFQSHDLPKLQAIRCAAFAPIFASFREIVGAHIAGIALTQADAEQANLLDDICKDGSSHRVFVAEINDEIVGFVSYTINAAERMGEIGLNAVHPDHAGKGVGARMYEMVMARMKDEGVAVATVGTGGDPSHAAARRAYEKVGFGPAIPSVYLYKAL